MREPHEQSSRRGHDAGREEQQPLAYPDATDVEYTYDAEDNVTQTIDAIGNDIDDTYDSLNRRTARTVTRASGVLDTTTETFTYDAADRLLTAEDDDYDVEFTYGVLGLGSNVYEEKQAYATGTAYLKTVTKKYDAVGNKTSEVYPSSLALTYTWTDVNQVDTITDGTNTLADYAYAGLRRKQLVLGNNSQTHFTYGGFRGEVTTIDHQDNSGNSLLKLDYGYNKLHDRTFERYGSSGQPGDAFEYDKARRLTVAWMGSSTPSAPSGNTYVNKIQYGMDDDGNRTTVTVTPYGSSPVTTSYTDNNLNQYTAVGGVSRSHDGNGNVSDDGTYLYEYNYKNLICRVKLKSNSSTVAEYKYDALGRRVEKVITGATYRYIYSGVETVSVYTSTGTWKQDYVYGPGIDEVLMLEQADVLDWDGDSNTSEVARSWYRANALGSIMRIEEPDRTEAVTYRYDPYGELTITRGGSSQSSDPLGQYVTYTGRWRDEETGLYHYRARAYDPMRGRFMQRDPEGLRTGANLYTYCDSGPASRRDPDGRDWEEASTTVLAIGFGNTVTAKELADAALAAATASGIKGLHNGFGDAYRHCLWSCWMTRKIGRARAQVVGDNHEASGNRNGQPHAEFVMDSYNNRQGRICGAVCNETCHNCCMKKLRNGELSVIPQAQPGSPAPEAERQAYDGPGGESEAHEPEGTPYDKGGAQGNRYGGYAR